MPEVQRYDLIVIGSGPAGRRAAIQAAKLNRSVLVVDRGRRIGGVSVHTGTIPSKTLRETVLNLSGWRERSFYGLAYRVKKEISAADLLKRLHITLNHEVEVLEHQFARNGVMTLRGAARFVSPEEIEVTGDLGETMRYGADRFILAVGTRPYRPEHVPFDGDCVLDSDEILDLKRLPRASDGGRRRRDRRRVRHHLQRARRAGDPDRGARNQMLEFIDRELSGELHLRHPQPGHRAAPGLQGEGDRAQRRRDARSGSRTAARCARTWCCTPPGGWVRPRDLNLAACGLECDDRGRLEVDTGTFQTSVPHIYAAGDVIGFPSLASTSMEQGRIAACRAFDHACPGPAGVLPLRHLCGARDLDHRPHRGGGARAGASATNPASRAFARRRAATSWGSRPAF